MPFTSRLYKVTAAQEARNKETQARFKPPPPEKQRVTTPLRTIRKAPPPEFYLHNHFPETSTSADTTQPASRSTARSNQSPTRPVKKTQQNANANRTNVPSTARVRKEVTAQPANRSTARSNQSPTIPVKKAQQNANANRTNASSTARVRKEDGNGGVKLAGGASGAPAVSSSKPNQKKNKKDNLAKRPSSTISGITESTAVTTHRSDLTSGNTKAPDSKTKQSNDTNDGLLSRKSKNNQSTNQRTKQRKQVQQQRRTSPTESKSNEKSDVNLSKTKSVSNNSIKSSSDANVNDPSEKRNAAKPGTKVIKTANIDDEGEQGRNEERAPSPRPQSPTPAPRRNRSTAVVTPATSNENHYVDSTDVATNLISPPRPEPYEVPSLSDIYSAYKLKIEDDEDDAHVVEDSTVSPTLSNHVNQNQNDNFFQVGLHPPEPTAGDNRAEDENSDEDDDVFTDELDEILNQNPHQIQHIHVPRLYDSNQNPLSQAQHYRQLVLSNLSQQCDSTLSSLSITEESNDKMKYDNKVVLDNELTTKSEKTAETTKEPSTKTTRPPTPISDGLESSPVYFPHGQNFHNSDSTLDCEEKEYHNSDGRLTFSTSFSSANLSMDGTKSNKNGRDDKVNEPVKRPTEAPPEKATSMKTKETKQNRTPLPSPITKEKTKLMRLTLIHEKIVKLQAENSKLRVSNKVLMKQISTYQREQEEWKQQQQQTDHREQGQQNDQHYINYAYHRHKKGNGKNKRELFYGSPNSFDMGSNSGLSLSPTVETISADIMTFHKKHKKQLMLEQQQKIHAELIQRDIMVRKEKLERQRKKYYEAKKAYNDRIRISASTLNEFVKDSDPDYFVNKLYPIHHGRDSRFQAQSEQSIDTARLQSNLQSDIDSLKKKIEQLKEDLEEAREQLENEKSKNKELNVVRKRLLTEVEEKNDLVIELNNDLQVKQHVIVSLKLQLENLKEDMEDVTASVQMEREDMEEEWEEIRVKAMEKMEDVMGELERTRGELRDNESELATYLRVARSKAGSDNGTGHEYYEAERARWKHERMEMERKIVLLQSELQQLRDNQRRRAREDNNDGYSNSREDSFSHSADESTITSAGSLLKQSKDKNDHHLKQKQTAGQQLESIELTPQMGNTTSTFQNTTKGSSNEDNQQHKESAQIQSKNPSGFDLVLMTDRKGDNSLSQHILEFDSSGNHLSL